MCGHTVQVADLDNAAAAMRYSGLQPGDVLAFEGPRSIVGTHVAAYLGKREFMDSDFLHDGVGPMQLRANDPWFAGRVHIVRWTK